MTRTDRPFKFEGAVSRVRQPGRSVGRGRFSAGAPPISGRARPQTESAPTAPGSYFDTELDTVEDVGTRTFKKNGINGLKGESPFRCHASFSGDMGPISFGTCDWRDECKREAGWMWHGLGAARERDSDKVMALTVTLLTTDEEVEEHSERMRLKREDQAETRAAKKRRRQAEALVYAKQQLAGGKAVYIEGMPRAGFNGVYVRVEGTSSEKDERWPTFENAEGNFLARSDGAERWVLSTSWEVDEQPVTRLPPGVSQDLWAGSPCQCARPRRGGCPWASMSGGILKATNVWW